MLGLCELKDRIVSTFRVSPPNGWLLGWDERRAFDAIASAVAPHEFRNCTSFDYSFCNRYECTVIGQNDESFLLCIRISFIAELASLHWTRYSESMKEAEVVAESVVPDSRQIMSKVRTVLRSCGFSESPASWDDEPLFGVRLELSNPEAVTVGKCLYEDYEG